VIVKNRLLAKTAYLTVLQAANPVQIKTAREHVALTVVAKAVLTTSAPAVEDLEKLSFNRRKDPSHPQK
jgi:hypothetical protein